jgi:hypothetical protein
MPYGGSGGSSGPYGAGGGGYGFSPGGYGYGGSKGPSHLPGGVGGGGGGGWDYSLTILTVVIAAILLGAGITTIVWLNEPPVQEELDADAALPFVGATFSCEAKPADNQAANERDCSSYGWDGVNPLAVQVTLSGASNVNWSNCDSFFVNDDGSKEEEVDQPAFGSDGVIFKRVIGPDDLIAGNAQLKIRCSDGRGALAKPMRLAARFRFAIGRT